MALNIKDPEAVRLAGEVAAMTGESKTRAIRVALEERRARLKLQGDKPLDRGERVRRWAEDFRASAPPDADFSPVSKEELEEILGFGPDGV